MSARDQQLDVKITGGVLSISIGLDLLKHALEFSPKLQTFNSKTGAFQEPKITDMDVFGQEIVCALLQEDEDGTTPVHLMLDAAAAEAIESGAEGIELP